jgi:hypothetical protein
MSESAIPTQTCWGCCHLRFSAWSPGYGEYTPGSDFDIECAKKQWGTLEPTESQEDFGKAMEIGFTCQKFESRVTSEGK